MCGAFLDLFGWYLQADVNQSGQADFVQIICVHVWGVAGHRGVGFRVGS